jgi:general secretion pathway protein B
MSYILDALRRADSKAPSAARFPRLQSQQHAIAEDDAVAAPRSRWLLWAVVALAIALAAVLSWNMLGGSSAPPRPVAEGSVAPAPAPAAPVLLPTPPPVAATEDVEPLAPAAPPPGPTAPQATDTAPVAVAVAPPSAARPAAESKRSAARRSGAASSASARGSIAKAAQDAGESRVYTQAELPEDVRRDLPKLVIGGASYSGDAASRMVMINGQIFHEGDQLGHGLALEQIKLKSAILAYKGYRYEVTF